MRPKKLTGKDRYERARDAGLPMVTAAREAGIGLSFAEIIENLRRREAGNRLIYEPVNRDEALVDALRAAGGFSRLSERPTRQGHVVCLPLIPYEARP